MKKWKAGIVGMMMFGSVVLSSCGIRAADGADDAPVTAQEVAECTMESLKTLNLKRFNEYTDNYVETQCNWIGIPVENEYRVFNELLQPGVKVGKRKKKYDFNHKLAEKMLENLAWEVKDVRQDGDQAKITMEITNLNMADVMGKYEIYILENMLESSGTGLGQMIKDLTKIADDEGGLLTFVEACDKSDTCTLEVMVTAYQKNGEWKIHLNNEFINAFMGNIDGLEYSEDVQQRVDELERLQEEKMDEWAEEFGDKIERWADRLFAD